MTALTDGESPALAALRDEYRQHEAALFELAQVAALELACPLPWHPGPGDFCIWQDEELPTQGAFDPDDSTVVVLVGYPCAERYEAARRFLSGPTLNLRGRS